jgi:hypothetical protein
MRTGRMPDGVTNRKTHHSTPSLNDPAPRLADSRRRLGPTRTENSPSSDHSMARTALSPSSNTNDRMHRIPGAITATQIDARASHGRATANIVTVQTSTSHVQPSAAARCDGLRSIREQDAAQGGVAGIGWDIACQQITRDIRVGQFEKFDEGRAFAACGGGVPITQITQQKEIELFHAAPASPRKAAEFDFGRHG